MYKTDFVHHQKRRARFHDYRAPGFYHITISKNPQVPDFGRIEGDCRVAVGAPGCACVKLGPLGEMVRESILSLSGFHPEVKTVSFVVMPDHVHILLHVKQRTAKALGYFISNITGAATRAWRAISPCKESVFECGYNDRIIGPWRSLDVVSRYILENPHRLAVRHQFPEYFSRVNRLDAGGRSCRGYGNLLLLRNPFKEQIVIHRADTGEQREQKRQQWLHTAANGGVLVSPFISPAEKALRAEAEALGAKIILLTNDAMDERYKPSGHDFALCEEGRLFIIAPDGLGPKLSRADCLALNTLAAAIATV